MGGCHSRLDGSRDTYRKSAERKRKQAFQEDSGGPSGMVELGCFDGDKVGYTELQHAKHKLHRSWRATLGFICVTGNLQKVGVTVCRMDGNVGGTHDHAATCQ